MNRDTVVIIGSGLMGSGIAARSAIAGHRTVLLDQSLSLAEAGREKAIQNICQLTENQIIENLQAERAENLLGAGCELKKELAKAFWVIEAVTENLQLKQQLFQIIDELVPPEVIITSNTSGLRITDIARLTKHPERTATTHFWFPAHLVPLVEVVMSDKSAEEVALKLKELLLVWDKAPVIVRKDLPGQLANRILQAIIRESINIIQLGLATPEDVDTAIKMGIGIRLPVWGPLEHIDAVGLDLALSVQKTVLPGISNAMEPARYLLDLVNQGDLGCKTSQGFYNWKEKNIKDLMDKRDNFIMQALKIIKKE